MNSYSFPPVDDLIAYLKRVDYQRIWNAIITIVLFTAALIYILIQRFSVWYQNGGNDSIKETYAKVLQLLSVFYAWSRDRAIPALKNTVESVSDTCQAWQDLVTV